MARDSSLSQKEWNDKYSPIGPSAKAPCISCRDYVVAGLDDDVDRAAVRDGWLPCLERRWQCPRCWSAGGWQHIHAPIEASVWRVRDDNDGADCGLPTGWFVIEANGLTGSRRRRSQGGDWWLSDGYTSHACPVGSWLVVQDRRARVEPVEWLGRLMVEAGVMADEPF